MTYTYRIRAWSSRGTSAYSNNASDTTFSPPSVSQPPQSQTVVAGTSVNFSVTAGGTAPLSYQWQFNNIGLSGGTDTSLTLINAQPTNSGSYSVVVNNSEGSVTSDVAVLTVLVPPAITVQSSGLTAAPGTIASFSATATGTLPLFYQWQLNGQNLTDNGRILGASTNTLTLTNVLPADTGSLEFGHFLLDSRSRMT